MDFKKIKSPNYSKKPRKSSLIKFIIIHYTGMQSKRASIERLLSKKYKVSCHFLIDRKGEIFEMVETFKVAWHAGKSKWGSYVNLNQHSIGIELENKGHKHGYQSYSKAQISKLIKLCKILKKKFKIKSSYILGHSDIAPLRKIDPGEKFPWYKLAKKGIVIKTPKIKNIKIKSKASIRKMFFSNLHKIGYRYFNKKKNLKTDIFVIKAFQRRYLQRSISGKIDPKTLYLSHLIAHARKN